MFKFQSCHSSFLPVRTDQEVCELVGFNDKHLDIAFIQDQSRAHFRLRRDQITRNNHMEIEKYKTVSKVQACSQINTLSLSNVVAPTRGSPTDLDHGHACVSTRTLPFSPLLRSILPHCQQLGKFQRDMTWFKICSSAQNHLISTE